jgi:hypothetical protein
MEVPTAPSSATHASSLWPVCACGVLVCCQALGSRLIPTRARQPDRQRGVSDWSRTSHTPSQESRPLAYRGLRQQATGKPWRRHKDEVNLLNHPHSVSLRYL